MDLPVTSVVSSIMAAGALPVSATTLKEAEVASQTSAPTVATAPVSHSTVSVSEVAKVHVTALESRVTPSLTSGKRFSRPSPKSIDSNYPDVIRRSAFFSPAQYITF
jgi:hypothetical protein